MAYDDSGWKRRLVNGVILLFTPFYVIKKMMDYSAAIEEEEEGEELEE